MQGRPARWSFRIDSSCSWAASTALSRLALSQLRRRLTLLRRSFSSLADMQHNPITNACLHVDFQAVTDTTVIHSIVPVILEGDSAGVALGGVLDQTIHELAIICQVKDLPEAITADISGLKLGESLRIADLKLPSGVTTELAGDVIVAIVEAPRVSGEEAAPAAEEAVAEK